MSNLKHRIYSGISANLTGQLLTAVIQLLGLPIFLSCWGKIYYGEWLMLFTIPSYLGMSDLGLGTVATTEMAMLVSKDQTDKASYLFRSSFWGVVWVGVVVCLLFAFTTMVTPWHEWLGLQQFSAGETRITLLLLTAYVFGTIVLTLPLGIYRVTGKYGRGQMISNFFRLAEFVVMLLTILGGQKSVAAAAAMLIVRWVYIGFVWLEINKYAPWLKSMPINLDWAVIRPMLRPSLSMSVVYLGQSLVNQGLVTIIGVVSGAANVVVFTTIRTLCNFAKQIIGAINLSVFSEFSVSFGKGDRDTAYKLNILSTQANIALTLLAVIGFKILGPWVLWIWTHGEIDTEEPFFTFYLIYLLINSAWIGSWNMLLGSNQHVGLTRYFVFSSVIILISSYYLNWYFGLWVVPLILIITDFVFALMVFSKSIKVLHRSPTEYWKSLLSWSFLK